MEVPTEAIALIKQREGFRRKPYTDTAKAKNWTVGWGHKMLPSEIAQYGTSHELEMNVLETFFDYDVRRAYDAAKKQATVLQVADPHFINVLTSVNFQLGISWIAKFKETWQMLKSHEWERAAKHLEALPWFDQTPVRVRDFQEALRKLIT